MGNKLDSVTGPDTSGNMTYTGSAYRISADFVLTAAHVVYEWDRNETNPVIHQASGITDFNDYLGSPSTRGYKREVSLAIGLHELFPDTPITDNKHLEASPSLIAIDSIISYNTGSFGANYDGLVLFLDYNDISNSNSILGSTKGVDRYGNISSSSTGIIEAVSSDGSFRYSTLAIEGDSGGAYIVEYQGNDYILGTHSAISSSGKSFGNYFTTSAWLAINSTIESSKSTGSGNITTSQPNNLVIGKSSSDTITGSFRPDIILGRGGDDQIEDGDLPSDAVWADDLISGGDGSDTIFSGDGHDTLWGGDLDDLLYSGSDIDVADYSKLSKGLSIHFKNENDTAYFSVDDQSGSKDTLYSIETVIATTHRDMVYIEGSIPSSFDGVLFPVTIDARGGQGKGPDARATINADKHPGGANGLNIDISSDGSGTGTITDIATGGVINLIGFQTQIVGSKGADVITDESEGHKRIDAGGGDDEITVTQGAAEIFGGDGNDTIEGGSENDVISGGLGTENMLSGGDGNDFIISSGRDTVDGGDGDDYLLARPQRVDSSMPPGPDSLVVEFKGGAGNDLLDVREARYATIKFDADGGHDTLVGNKLESTYIGDGLFDYQPVHYAAQWGDVTIDISSLSKEDVTFIWDAQILNYAEGYGDHSACYDLMGEMVLRINSTGATIFLGLVGGQASGWDGGTLGDIWLDSLYISVPIIKFSDGEWYGGVDSSLPGVTFGAVSSYDLAADDFADGTDPGSADDGTAGDDELKGGAGDDSISAGDGDDYIEASAGNDSYDGGNGSDTVDFFGRFQSYQFSLDSGHLVVRDQVHGGQATLTAIEDLYFLTDNRTITAADIIASLGTSGNDTIIGLAFNDHLKGLAGDDTISGNAGDDLIDGGDGSDTARFSGNSTDFFAHRDEEGRIVITDLLGNEGIDTLIDIETISFSGDSVSVLASLIPTIGTSGADTIVGTALSELLDGREGDDEMAGGGGNDEYRVDSTADIVIEAANEGTDIVVSTVNYVLPDHVENLRLVEWAAQEGTGNALNNIIWSPVGYSGITLSGMDGDDTLIGGDGDDTLYGGDGDDTLIAGDGLNALFGGDGNDVAQFSGAPGDYRMGVMADGVVWIEALGEVWSLTTLDGVEAFEFTGGAVTLTVADLPDQGTVGNDSIDGSAGADFLGGGEGADTLNGGGGADKLDGGDGDDTISGGDGDDTLESGAGNDFLEGGDGHDFLIGGDGADTQFGGDGDDIYYDVDASDTVTELADEGLDSVFALGSHTLSANVEDLYLRDGGSTGTGNALNNRIEGSDWGDESLFGLDGNDTLLGLGGNDSLKGGDGDDTIDGGDGDDVAYFSGSSTDFLITPELDGSVTVEDLYLGDGEDTLIDVEEIYFAGDNVTILVSELFA